MTSDLFASRRRIAIAAAATALLGAGAAALWWNAPRESAAVHARPEAAAAPHPTGNAGMNAVLERLAARLRSNPGDAEGWAMLARSYASLGRHADAVPAYANAVKLQPGDAALLADYADALGMQQGRQLAGEPMQWVQRSLAIDPAQPKALLLAGTEAFDRGDMRAAEGYWSRVLRAAPPSSELARHAHAGLMQARQR